MAISRRAILGAPLVAAAGSLLPTTRVRAQTDDVIRLGVLTDMSGIFRNNGGPTAVACAKQAVQDFGAANRGIKVEVLAADHQNKPDIGLGIARQWFDRDGVDVILDVNNSGIAVALIPIAQEKDRIQLNTGAGTGDLTGPKCAFNTVHWGYDTYVFAHSTGGEIVRNGGKTWFFITADYVFGHSIEKDATAVVERLGGRVVGHILYPGAGATTDFSSQLIDAQSSGAEVIGLATSGLDFVNLVKQAHEFGLPKTHRVAGLSVFINDINGLGLEAAQNLMLTETFYWDLNDRTRSFMSRVKDKVGDNWPSMEHAGAYSATMHYLKTVAEIGVKRAKASGGDAMAAMRKMPTDDDCFGPGAIRTDGCVLHPAYLFQVKTPSESHGPWDYYKLVGTTPAEEAWRPLNETGCPLVKT
jgi:branched-chain amino acid transport system substrate-binding protein